MDVDHKPAPKETRECRCGGTLTKNTAPLKYRNPLEYKWFNGRVVCGTYWQCDKCKGKFLPANQFSSDFQQYIDRLQFYLDRRNAKSGQELRTERSPANKVIVAPWLK